jgi:hypothetical protein
MLRHLVTVAALSSVVIACSSSDDAAETGPCAQRSGSYIARYTVRSGDCGATAEVVLNVDKQPTSVDPPCTGSISYTPDNCEVTYSSSCPNDGAVKGATLTVTGKSEWRRDAEVGTAVEDWSLVDANGQTVCHGTYDVLITKQ